MYSLNSVEESFIVKALLNISHVSCVWVIQESWQILYVNTLTKSFQAQ